ncbi:MAG: bifunctional metallophosphatase/5'-nucleotidase [Candidatus Riflebacteria bacterium]|nr:bifunctional metallophosphatase/5'-nucleotidase [Candidatus Riflebacteria bacterium]
MYGSPKGQRKSSPQASEPRAVIAYLSDLHWNFLIYPRIVHSLAEHRARFPQLLYFDIGDTLSDVMDGRPLLEMMNLARVDGWVLGNHDFDYGLPYLMEKVRSADFPAIVSNVQFNGSIVVPCLPYVIHNLKGFKVGFFGLTTPDYPLTHDKPETLEVLDPLATARSMIRTLRGRVDCLILLSHLGFDADCGLASQTRGIDAIIGGHSHTLLEVPEVVNNVLICQAGGEGHFLGYLHLETRPGGGVSFKNELVPLDERLPEDQDCLAVLRDYLERQDHLPGEVLGEALTSFVDQKYGRETRLGNLVCDVLREETGADLSFYNATAVNNVIPRGKIFSHDFNIAFHFDNGIYVTSLKAWQIKEVLEKALESSLDDNYYYLHLSGLTVRYSSRGPAGSKVLSIESCGRPLDPNRYYRVAITEFLAKGGHERGTQFAVFRHVSKEPTHLSVRAMMKRYILRKVRINASLEGRIQDIDARATGH